jgi:hypothetical protein
VMIVLELVQIHLISRRASLRDLDLIYDDSKSLTVKFRVSPFSVPVTLHRGNSYKKVHNLIRKNICQYTTGCLYTFNVKRIAPTWCVLLFFRSQ